MGPKWICKFQKSTDGGSVKKLIENRVELAMTYGEDWEHCGEFEVGISARVYVSEDN